MEATRDFQRFLHVKKAFNSELKRLDATGGRAEVAHFRGKVCADTGLSPAQLSRFETGPHPSKYQGQKRYHYEAIEQFLIENNLITLNAPTIPESIASAKENFVPELKRLIDKYISSQTDKIDRAFNDQVLRALMHIAVREYGRREREDLKFHTLFLKYVGGYRIVSPYPSKTQANDYLSVSGLYIDKSPFEDLAVFQEVLGEKNGRITYKGICYSVGDVDDLTHFFFSFHTGRIQLMIVKLDVRNSEVWLEGTRLNFDSGFGALAVPVVGRFIGPNVVRCFQKRGREKISEFLEDKEEPFRHEMIERLGFKRKWARGDYVFSQI